MKTLTLKPKTLFLVLAIIFLIIALNFIYPLSCMGGCFVEKYSPKWFFTMSKSNISNMPIIDPTEKPSYYYDTDLGEYWTISYYSKSNINKIKNEIINFLNKENIKTNGTGCSNGYWTPKKETIEINCQKDDRCIMIYLDQEKTLVSIKVLEMK